MQSSIVPISIPAAASAGRRSRFQSFDWRTVNSATRSWMRASACCGVKPSAERTPNPAVACPMRPATRTMKNSSRFEEKIDANRTRSSSGCAGSAARSSTRAFNSIHESSRFSSRDGAACVSTAMGEIVPESARWDVAIW